jgi:CCR4-NOT transcription complex subunit 2
MGGTVQRNQSTPHSQQGQQDDFFPSSSRMNTNQGAFRFGNQTNMSQSSQPQPNSIDEFPPLNNSLRNGDGEIGQERGSTLMSTLGFGAQGNSAGSLQGTRTGNGLLNALSANSRATDVRSPDGTSALGISLFPSLAIFNHGLISEYLPYSTDQSVRNNNDEARQKPPGFRDDALSAQSPKGPSQPSEGRNLLGAIGNKETKSNKNKDNEDTESLTVCDPLAGMAEIDKWGIKGLRTLMNNYPDYAACVAGMDPQTFGFDLTSPG